MGSLVSRVLCLFNCIVAPILCKQASIRANSSALNGIQILYNPSSVIINANEWITSFQTQQGYDLLLELSNEWGFDPITSSYLTLILNGTTHNEQEGDLLFVFSAANSQYFGLVIRNEIIGGQAYKTYPQPMVSSLAYSNDITSSIIFPSTPDRWDRITNQTRWYNTIPIYNNPINSVASWPIKLVILNDPINNIVRCAQIDTFANTELYSATFLSSFTATDQGIDVYIMTDGIGESFGIYDITVEHYVPTLNPTLEPTIFPTVEPTLETYISEPFTFSTTDIVSPSPTSMSTATATSSSVIASQSPTSTPMVYESTEGINEISKPDTDGSNLNDLLQQMDLVKVLIIAGTCCGLYCVCASLILSCFCARSHYYAQGKRKNSAFEYSHSNMVIVYPKNVKLHQKYNDKKAQYGASDTSEEFSESETEIYSEETHEDEEKEGELRTKPQDGVEKVMRPKKRLNEVIDNSMEFQHGVNVVYYGYDKHDSIGSDDEVLKEMIAITPSGYSST